MYKDLKFLVRVNHRKHRFGLQQNSMKLILLRIPKRTMLAFHKKPPSEVRNYMRSCNYSWSRKYAYWHSYFGKDKVRQIKKIIQLLNN